MVDVLESLAGLWNQHPVVLLLVGIALAGVGALLILAGLGLGPIVNGTFMFSAWDDALLVVGIIFCVFGGLLILKSLSELFSRGRPGW